LELFAVKQHLDTIERENKRIAEAESKLARTSDEERKHAAAHDAAVHHATELRTKAAHAAALAAIGEGSEADAQQLAQEAAAAEKRATDIAAAIDGMGRIKSDAQASIAAARVARQEAKTAALDIHAEGVLAEYETAAAALVRAFRRVRALEIIRRSDGDVRRLLITRECKIPATVASTSRRVGMYDDLLFSGERESFTECRQRDAVDAEIEALERAGLEV
jgi:hypothetical protein